MTSRLGSRHLAITTAITIATVSLQILPAQAYPRPGRTERISLAVGGMESNGNSTDPVISSDGGVVAFETLATNLVPGEDDNLSKDIIVHDRATGETEKVSVSSDGQDALGNSDAPSISADGAAIVFESLAVLVTDDTNKTRDIYVHDRATGTTERVSVASDGAQATDRSFRPSISGNGRFVTFESMAGNLVPGDTNETWDIFVHDRVTKTTERVSVTSDGAQGRCTSIEPDIDHDGRYVVFRGFVSECLPGQTDGTWQLFVHDRQTRTTERIPVPGIAPDSIDLIDDIFRPEISGDGRIISFFTYAPNVVPSDTNGAQDIFVYDRQTGTTQRVSVASDGSQSNNDSLVASLSPDGRFVGFYSLADLGTGATNDNWNSYVHDLETGVTERISVTADSAGGNHYSFGPALSEGARVAAFHSFASDLIPNDTNTRPDIFVRERGPALGVSGLTIEPAPDELLVSGFATFSGATVTTLDDPDNDSAVGVLQATDTGTEITAAEVIVRPEVEDLLLRLELAELPAEEDPGPAYRWSFKIDGRDYEVRAFRAAVTGSPLGAPHFALYECGESCVETTRLSGGIGTTGTEARVSVPLTALEVTPSSGMTAIVAAAGFGDYLSGPLVRLDDVALPDAPISARSVALGIAPAGTPEPEVAFDNEATLSNGEFSGSLDVEGFSDGPYDVWARTCLGANCSATSVPVALGDTSQPLASALELSVDGVGINRILRARLFDPSTDTGIANRTIDFHADGVLIGSATTSEDGIASLEAPPRYRGGKHDFVADFAGDQEYLPARDEVGS